MPKSKSDNKGNPGDVSRRSFLKGMGSGVVSTTVLPGIVAAADKADTLPGGQEGITESVVSLKVNGKDYRVKVESRASLASVIHDELKITGTKTGCNSGECGCCTVLMDGVPVYSCMTLAFDADGKEITTIEGIDENGRLSPIQESFIEYDAYQCGFCTPGQVLTATALLKDNPDPSVQEIKNGMSGVLCRCSSYQNIIKAVENAAGKMRG